MKYSININNLEDIILTNNINFYWEDLNQNYPINKRKNYLIYFKGCFGPPTIGHMNAIKKIINYFGSDVKIIINQLGLTKRHGIDKEYNKYIMKKYINTLFPNNNISLLFRARFYDIKNHPYLDKTDVFIIIKGCEENIDEISDIEKIENIYTKQVKNYKNFLFELNIKLDFILQNRPHNEISASKFIKCLINYKDKLNNNLSLETEIDKILKFIPYEIKLKDTIKIVDKLINYPLK